ncbi:MAG: DUF2397 domain-containing protein, partial [Actinomycetota bacterium]|nr:DUF2397 domain-containing protein [Actinomycetota bacterium]
MLLAHAQRELDEVARARRRIVTSGPLLLSELGELDTRTFRLFLGLLGDALSARSPRDTDVKTTTSDGSMEVRLSLVPDGGEVEIDTEDGVLRGPEHVIDIVDLRRPAESA